MIPEPLLLPLVVMGLVGSTLILAALASRHQQQQQVRRSVIQRMETAIRRVDEALATLAQVPVPAEVRMVLRRDILDRYRMIGQVCRRCPGLTEQLDAAAAALRAITDEPATSAVPLAADEDELTRWIAALEELGEVCGRGGTIHPLSGERSQSCRQRLGECIADVAARFFVHRYKRLVGELAPEAAEVERQRLSSLLSTRCPDTPHVRSLRQAVGELIDSPGEEIVEAAPDEPRKFG
jgi:hypothetical protein